MRTAAVSASPITVMEEAAPTCVGEHEHEQEREVDDLQC